MSGRARPIQLAMDRVPHLLSDPARRGSRASFAPRRWGGCIVLLTVILLLVGPTVRTQQVTEASLKAAFLFNFARFTEWPPEVLPANAQLTFCVVNDGAVGDALVRTVKGRSLAGRGINVLQVQPDRPLRPCHLLYITSASEAQVAAIVKSVGGAAVLTVSEFDDFARKGGILQVFVENGKIKFRINLGLARRVGLQLSSKLLGLADEVFEQPAGGRP